MLIEKRKGLLGDDHEHDRTCQGRWNDTESLEMVVMEEDPVLMTKQIFSLS